MSDALREFRLQSRLVYIYGAARLGICVTRWMDFQNEKWTVRMTHDLVLTFDFSVF